MTLFLIVLVAIFLVSLWVFLRSSPKQTRKKALTVYNIGTLITAVILCTLFTLRIYTNMAGGPDPRWWPVLSLAGSLVIFTACLLIGNFIRNSVIFRHRRTFNK